MLSGVFRVLNAYGEASRTGYLFRVWLVGRDGGCVGEPSAGFAPGGVDPDAAESRFIAFVRPVQFAVSGRRTFVADASGAVWWTGDARWSGEDGGPTPEAFKAPGGRGWTRAN